MATNDDISTVASLLKDTNKKLDKLSADNEKSNSVTSIVAQSLPEILSDRAIASRQEKYDKKEGVTEVDEAVQKNTKDIVSGLKSLEASNKLSTAVEKIAAAKAAKENQSLALELEKTFSSLASVQQKLAKENAETKKIIEEGAAAELKANQNMEKRLEALIASAKADNRTNEKAENWLADLQLNMQITAEKAEATAQWQQSSAGQAVALKKELESQGKIAEDNKEYSKLSFKARKEDYAQRLADATSPAAKKEIREEARADAKKNGNLLQKIVAGIGGLWEIGKKGLKAAALGGLAILSTLAIGAFLIALGEFLQSDTFKELSEYISGVIIPKVKELYDAFFGEGGGIGAGFDKLAEMFSDKGALVIGLGLLTAGWLTSKAIGLLLSPLTLGFKAITTAFSLAGGALSDLGLKNTPKTTTAPTTAAGAAPAAGGTKPSVVGTDSTGKKIVNSAAGNPMQMGADGKATSQKPVGKVTATKAPMSLNPLKKFPKVGKFLGVLKRIPLLSSVFAISDLVSIFSNDKMSTKAKIAAGVGVFGGVGASILGGALGMMFGGPIGAAIGGLAGYFGGETLATGLMQWMLGEKVDAFPDAWWAPDINGWMNGSGEKKKPSAGASPTGSPTGSPTWNDYEHPSMSPIIKGNTGGNVTPLQTGGSGTTGANITPSNKLSASIDRLSAIIDAQGAAGPTNIVDARQSSSVTTTGQTTGVIMPNKYFSLNSGAGGMYT
jgi:hypothetical protein